MPSTKSAVPAHARSSTASASSCSESVRPAIRARGASRCAAPAPARSRATSHDRVDRGVELGGRHDAVDEPERSASAASKRSPSRSRISMALRSRRGAAATRSRRRPASARSAGTRTRSRRRRRRPRGRRRSSATGRSRRTAPWTRPTTGCGIRCSSLDRACRRPIMRSKRAVRSAGGQRRAVAGERPDVAAGHEVLAGAAQHDDAQRVVVRRPPPCARRSASIIADRGR